MCDDGAETKLQNSISEIDQVRRLYAIWNDNTLPLKVRLAAGDKFIAWAKGK